MQNDRRQTALLFSWLECLCGQRSLNLFSPVLITEDVVLNKNNMLSDIYCTAEENNTRCRTTVEIYQKTSLERYLDECATYI